jgi:hypothetical protein
MKRTSVATEKVNPIGAGQAAQTIPSQEADPVSAKAG